jgi:hypothetical protein
MPLRRRIQRTAGNPQRVLGISLGGFPLPSGTSSLPLPSASLAAMFEDPGVLPYVRAGSRLKQPAQAPLRVPALLG